VPLFSVLTVLIIKVLTEHIVLVKRKMLLCIDWWHLELLKKRSTGSR